MAMQYRSVHIREYPCTHRFRVIPVAKSSKEYSFFKCRGQNRFFEYDATGIPRDKCRVVELVFFFRK